MVKIKKHRQSIVIGLLCVGLIVLGNSYISNYTSLLEKYAEVLVDYQWARESLERSTLELVEVRKLLVPSDFEDYEELEGWVLDWVKINKPMVVEFFGFGLLVSGNSELAERYADCDNFAEAMQRDALRDGHRLSEALVDSSGAVYGVKVSQYSDHAGNLAVAGGVYYFIEPQTGEIVRIVNRD